MATHTTPGKSTVDQAMVDRTHVVYARHQWFALAVFGTLSCVAALVFSRWDPAMTSSRWFWIIVGPMAGVVAMFKAQSQFGQDGADRDAGPYIGVLIATTIGAIVIASLSLAGWILPAVFLLVAGFLGSMAWLEQSGIGMTTALTVAVLAAATAVTELPGSVVSLSLTIGMVFLAGSLALLVCRAGEIAAAETPLRRSDGQAAR
ncbi:MAG: hypothetical protein AAF547_21270 [Actinomycetota bacterium]